MEMIRRMREPRAGQEGSALPLAVLAMLLLSVLGFALVTLGQTETTISGNWRSYSASFYGADAGIESGVVGLRNTLTNVTPTPSTSQLNAIAAPTLNNTSLTFSTYSITQTPAPYTANMPSGAYAGLSGLFTDYKIVSQVRGQNGTAANLTQVFHYVGIPLFQFAIFYGAGVDLEISPGANMTINGKVFANSNIYLSPQSGATLDMQGLVATAGNIYRTIKRSGNPPVEGYGGNPQIMNASGAYQTLNFDHVDNQNFASSWTSAQWQTQAQSTFGGTVKDSAMGVQQIVPPIPQLFYNPSNPDQVAHEMIELPNSGDTTALADAKLYAQAGVVIVNGVATTQSGSSVSLPSGLITTSTFYDQREQNMMQVTNVDISKIPSSWVSSGGVLANGLLYVANSSGGPSAPCAQGTRTSANPCPAVRLINGSTMPSSGGTSSGLTVASQNPVYVLGNYNTTMNGPGGTDHPPAAILADAITVLSNNWSDTNAATSASTLSNRNATSTTVNAAFATGPSAESTSAGGNGQLENDIRLLENWSGQTLTYTGSIVDLWHSEQVTAPWQNTGVYYNAPTRNWSYDTLFNTTPPPGTPRGVVMTRGAWAQN